MADLKLRYGGKDFSVITDSIMNRTPCPLVTIDASANKDGDGNILSIVNSINLNSTIVGNSFSGCVASYSGVIDFFSDNLKQGKTLQIICENTILAEFSGTYFNGGGAKDSSNNWVISIPWTVSLESVSSAKQGDGLITSFDESWTIEPVEEVSYYNISSTGNYYGPGTIPQNRYPLSQPPSLSAGEITSLSKTFNISNFLQYRVSHKVSAVGKTLDFGNINNPVDPNNRSQAHAQAAKWVLNRANSAYLNSSNNGLSVNGLNLYNHIRSINTSISAGSYDLTDTWLALATGINYTEEFTWEVSTDDKYVKTVTMQGTIKGLESAKDNPVIFPDVAMTGNITSNLKNYFPNQTSANNKFNNAIKAYNSNIKPTLYQRASQALSSVSDVPVGSTWIKPTTPVLNISPLSYTESLNANAGTVGYSVVYNSKPGAWIKGALNTNITVTDTLSTDQIAEIFVLGRPLGPILEKVGKTKSERRLSVEVLYPAPRTYAEGASYMKDSQRFQELSNMVYSFKPLLATMFFNTDYHNTTSGKIFETTNTQAWNPIEGRFTWDITWAYASGC
jgi:hypothetical protein